MIGLTALHKSDESKILLDYKITNDNNHSNNNQEEEEDRGEENDEEKEDQPSLAKSTFASSYNTI